MKSILKKITTLQERISRLKALALKINSFEDYLSSKEHIDIAERNLQVAIESCLDIGKIIIANQNLREPEDNKGIFFILCESGLIDKSCLSFLIPMAGTRNILVHGYDRVDDALVYGIIKRHLSDFEKFLTQIYSLINNENFSS